MELVAAEKVGGETVQHVSKIYKYSLVYVMVEVERAERARVKQ